MNCMSLKQRIGFAVIAMLACMTTLSLTVVAPALSAGGLA